MNHLITTYTLLVLSATVLLLLASWRRHRMAQRREALRHHYLTRIVAILRDDDAIAARHVEARGRSHRTALAEALHTVACHTYGADTRLLRTIARRNRLDRFLMYRITMSAGYVRARYLALAAAVPALITQTSRLRRHTRSRNPYIRIYALTALLAATPSEAILTVAAYPHRLSPFDITQIIALLRRGLLPIAFGPLLTADNPNLRMLGLGIVRSFGIETACGRICRIAEQDPDPDVADEALHTLALLGDRIPAEHLYRRIASFDASRRKSLCRFFAAQGYSIKAIEALFSANECEHARRMIDSYKTNIVCRSQYI